MIWKDIKGFEGLYKVSDTGLVLSLGKGLSTNPMHNKEKIMKTQIKKSGYEYIKLSKDGIYSYHRVHRLVADNFIENKENKPQVNHIDGDKLNNNVSNLEWNTSKENIQHSFRTGLQVNKKGSENSCSKGVIQLTTNDEVVRIWGSLREITNETGFNRTGIIGCCKEKDKYNTAYGYKWRYTNGI